MNLADKYYKDNLINIKENGCIDENPRPKYKDGTPAHCKFVTQVFEKYDISKGEFPIPTLRRTFLKTGLKELYWIYQDQSNNNKPKNYPKWWDEWLDENDSIGKAYAYNLESHRDGEMTPLFKNITIKPIVFYSGHTEFPVKDDVRIDNMKFLPGHLETLKEMWKHMIEFNDANTIHYDWYKLYDFLNAVRHLPQYHLAKEDNFKGWVLYNNYYGNGTFDAESASFIKVDDEVLYSSFDANKSDNRTVRRKELSRNQVNELLRNLVKDPYGRRHIISFWNWANIDKKQLVECAYETIWTVRNVNGVRYLDTTLIQRKLRLQ